MKTNNLTKEQKQILREVRNVLTMHNCSFRNLSGDPNDPLPKTEIEVTAFIRRRTWMESRVMPDLDALLNEDHDTARALRDAKRRAVREAGQ